MFVCFSIGKLGVSTPGCVNEVTEMECSHSEIDELIKEVRGGSISRGLAQRQKPHVLWWAVALFMPCQGIQSLGLSPQTLSLPQQRQNVDWATYVRPASTSWSAPSLGVRSLILGAGAECFLCVSGVPSSSPSSYLNILNGSLFSASYIFLLS